MSDEVTFKFILDKPMIFDFQIRQPNWSSGLESTMELGDLKDGFYTVSNEWKNGDEITIKFNNDIKQYKAFNDEVYLQRGPIVYAYEISHKEETIKTYAKANYRDYYCFPTNQDYKNLALTTDAKFELKSHSNYHSFYDSQWNLKGSLYNTSKNENQDVTLIPIGKTVLRRVTFPILETSN
jgi:DUF1680 family protein